VDKEMPSLSRPPVSVAKAAVAPKATDRRGSAIYLGVGVSKVDEMLATGVLRGKRHGRRWIIPIAELDRLLNGD
jgi:excisionase family DNA binding protein